MGADAISVMCQWNMGPWDLVAFIRRTAGQRQVRGPLDPYCGVLVVCGVSDHQSLARMLRNLPRIESFKACSVFWDTRPSTTFYPPVDHSMTFMIIS